MILTIWRHGIAEEGGSDRQRMLAMAGRDDVGFGCRQLGNALELRKIRPPQRILHSPWVRTAQTAEVIAMSFSLTTVDAHSALQPGSDIAAVEEMIAAQVNTAKDREQHVVLVSHQPLVSRLADYLLGEPGSVPSLPPGGLVVLSLGVPARGCATLLFWAFPPEYEVSV